MRKLIALFLLLPTLAFGADYFDWSVRTDRDGKPAGYFTTTPFPVTEASTEYSITNDEGTKTFTLGTIYFVDGSGTGCSNGSTNYKPATRVCEAGGAYTVYTTPPNAIAGVAAGNKTILVRTGTYTFTGMTMRAGTDDTHRYSMIGYNQERPVFEGSATPTSAYILRFGSTADYATIQRVTFQNHDGSCLGADGAGYPPTRHIVSPNVIDVYTTLCHTTSNFATDGNMFHASNGLWIYHSTAEKSYGHAFKMSDGAKNSLVEWSIAQDIGWWAGQDTDVTGTGHPSGFDYPDTAENHTLRYSIARRILFNPIQVRGNLTYGPDGIGTVNIHHVEVSDSPMFESVTGESGHDTASQIIFNGCSRTPALASIINFRENIVRDTSDTAGWGLRVYCPGDQVNAYNNLFYGNKAGELAVTSSAVGMAMSFSNNTFYHTVNNPVVNNGAAADLTLTNNIIYHQGTGAAMSVGSAGHTYNLYYAPNGSVGVTLGTGEINADPSITAPSGAYSSGEGAPQVGSVAIDNGIATSYATSFNGVNRVTFDIGAYEYGGGISAFSFTDNTDVASSTVIYSDSITVSGSGFTTASISLTGTGCFYQVNGAGSWLTSGPDVSLNDNVALKTTSLASAATPQQTSCTLVLTGGSSVASDTWYVTTIAVPTIPTLVSPSDDSTGLTRPITFTWNAVEGAELYEIQIATDSAFTDIVIDAQTVNTSYEATTLLPSMRYYWRVRALQ